MRNGFKLALFALVMAMPIGIVFAALEGVDTRSGNQSSVNLSGGGLQTGFPPHALAVTASDATTFTEPSTIYVGTAGTVVVEPLIGGNTVTFTMPAGSVVPVVVKRVLAASTATNMVRVY